MPGSIVLSPSSLSIVPGEAGAVTVQVRNTGTVVDQFAVTVLGDAASWATVSPPAISLFPGSEGTAQVIFNPPRDATVPCGPMHFGIRVVPHEDPDASLVEEGVIDVAGFTQVAAKVTPRNSQGKRSAVHTVFVENRGNTDVETEIDATDPDEAMVFDIRPAAMSIPPGGSGTATVKVAPRDKIRDPAPRPFQIIVRPGQEPPVVLDASMTQKRKPAPKWIAPVVAGGIAVALAAVLLPQVMNKDKSGNALLTSGQTPTTAPAAPAAPAGGEVPAEEAGGGDGGGAPAPAPAPTAAPTPAPTAAPPPTAAPKPNTPSRVVFRRNVGGKEHIFSMNIDGSDVKQLTSDGEWNTHPTWSPDRKRIYFTRSQSGSNSKIWVMNADGSDKKQLTSTGPTVNDSIPSVSPDGSKIAFVSDREHGKDDFDLWVMNADGSGQVNLTKSAGIRDHWPTWSPDSKRLAWQRGGEIWVMNADGSAGKAVAKGSHPAWSPTNARLIAYASGTLSTQEITLLDVERPNDPQPKLTQNDKEDTQPSWMADGSRIVFTSKRDGNWEIYVMDGGGGGQTRLTKTAEDDTLPQL